MSDKVGRLTPGVSIPAAPRRTASAEASPIEPVHVVDGPDIRLLVEEPEPGKLVYVLVDARTGKVLSRLTDEHLDRMAQDPGYAKGRVIDRKA
jgi:hypothetical protein